MEQITNKKELLAALGPWIPNAVGRYGEERAASLFIDLESERAVEINKEIIDNLQEEFNKHTPVSLTPQDFIRIAVRNIDLNTPIELLHFMFQVGLMWETTIQKISNLKNRPPNIGEN